MSPGPCFLTQVRLLTLDGMPHAEQIAAFAGARVVVGQHGAALTHAAYMAEGTTLVVVFDAQPTNRGGMTGVGPCAAVLGDATVALLRGAAADAPRCFWEDDSTLVAYLNYLTDAGPGMAVTVRPGVLWPKMWPWPGTCAGDESMCADAITLNVDAYFPCDERDTAEIEGCVVPQAYVQAPESLSSCPAPR